ncbi:acid phosphatase [Aureococcus anophagefferens]|nr:acid phosphatase [Aureococcus anophagefferens]
MLNLAVDKINALKPRPQFAIVCGDLVHPFPRARRASPKAGARHAEYQRITARIDPGIALVCVCGNHDVGNVPSRASVTKFEKRFGPSYGEFRCGRTRCIVLNSQLLNAKEDFWSEEPHVEAARDMALEQDAWLGTRFPCRTLFFSHVPPFVEAPDEPKGYFNHEPEVVVRPPSGASAGTTTLTREERLSIPGMDWAKRRCDAAHSGLRVVCYAPDDAVFHKFFALEDVPETIDFAEARRTWAGLAPTPTSWASPDRPPTPPTPPASWSRECVLPPHPRT